MFKNCLKKLSILCLCFALCVPAFLSFAGVAYGEDPVVTKTALVYTDAEFTVPDGYAEIKKAAQSDIIISYKKDTDATWTEAYKDAKTDYSEAAAATFSFNASKDIVSVIFKQTGNFEISVKVKDKEENYLIKYNVTDDYHAVKLGFDTRADRISAYKTAVINALKDDNAEDGENYKVGETFTAPSLEEYLITDLPYGKIYKTLHYVTPGASSASTKSGYTTDLRFTLDNYGDYRFWFTLSTAKLTADDDSAKKVSTDYLKQEDDGFYEYKKVSGEKVYYVGDVSDGKFYNTEDGAKNKTKTDICSEDVVKGDLIVPVYSFELKDKGPSIKIASSYQEDGYIGGKYTVKSISVYGSFKTTYTLKYKASESAEAVKAEEKLDTSSSSSLTFTPTKKGIYYIEVTATDSLYASTETARTANITVNKKYTRVTYKTSFSDWLKVNTVPFVLLCISGACLVAIICLLFIKPKDEVKKAEEQDK